MANQLKVNELRIHVLLIEQEADRLANMASTLSNEVWREECQKQAKDKQEEARSLRKQADELEQRSTI